MCRAYVLFWPWTAQDVQAIGPVAYLTNAKQVKSELESHFFHTPKKRRFNGFGSGWELCVA